MQCFVCCKTCQSRQFPAGVQDILMCLNNEKSKSRSCSWQQFRHFCHACAGLFLPDTLLSEVLQRSEVVGEVAVQIPRSVEGSESDARSQELSILGTCQDVKRIHTCHTYIHAYTYIHTYIHTYITLHCIALHCIALHCITLHYITLHYITLHTYIHR